MVKEKLNGIGGWLILPTIKLVFMSFTFLYLAYLFSLDVLSFEQIYDLSLRFFLISGVMAFFSIYTLILEFQHKEKFTWWAIFVLLINIPVLLYLDLGLGFAVGFENTLRQFVINYAVVIAYTVALILYIKKSKRVKNTFVK